MSTASPDVPADTARVPTVAKVAFPDGREGLFGVRDTSTVHAAVVAFALSKMSTSEIPAPVLAMPTGEDSAEPAPPTVGDVVGTIDVARLRALEESAAGDHVSDHMGPIPPSVRADATAGEALDRIGSHEVALVVRDDVIVGTVSRQALTAALDDPGSAIE